MTTILLSEAFLERYGEAFHRAVADAGIEAETHHAAARPGRAARRRAVCGHRDRLLQH